MPKNEAYIAMRVLLRINQQMARADAEQRYVDGRSLAKLIGGLEYNIYQTFDCERALEAA